MMMLGGDAEQWTNWVAAAVAGAILENVSGPVAAAAPAWSNYE